MWRKNPSKKHANTYAESLPTTGRRRKVLGDRQNKKRPFSGSAGSTAGKQSYSGRRGRGTREAGWEPSPQLPPVSNQSSFQVNTQHALCSRWSIRVREMLFEREKERGRED